MIFLFRVSGLGSHLVEGRLGHIGSLFSLVKFVLELSELAEIAISLFLSLLGLSLVGLDLDLELVNELLDSAQVLLVLVALVADLLDLSLHLAVGLDALGGSLLLGIKLVLELSHASFELLHLLSATLERNLLGLVESNLELLDRALHVLLHSLEMLALILLLLELLAHHRGIGDGLLGLLFGVSALRDGLLDLASEKVGSSLNNSHLLADILDSSLGLVELGQIVLQLALKQLSLFGGLVSLSVGVAKLDLKIVEVALELLLLSDGLGSGLALAVEAGLHGLKGSLAVSSGVVDLLFLLGKSALEVLLTLSHLNGESKHLGLLGFNGSLGLLKSGLKLVSLLLESSLGLLELVDGLSALAKLISQIGDLLLQVLALSLDSLEAVKSLLVSVLGLEELGAHASRLLLAALELDLKLFLLLLVLSDNLVEVTLLLVQSGGGRVGSLEVDLQIFELAKLSLLGLLKRSALSLSGLNHLFHLLELLRQLLLGVLELLGSLNSVGLVLGPPRGNLSVGLAQLSLKLGLGLLLLFVLLSEQVVVVSAGLDGVGKRGLGLGLLIKSSLELLVVLGSGVLGSSELGNELLLLLDRSLVLTVLSHESSLHRVKLVTLAALLLVLVLGLVELILEMSAGLFEIELGLGDRLDVTGEVVDLHLHLALLLFKLLLDSLKVINGLAKLSDLVGLLLSKVGHGALVSQVGLL